MSNASGDAHTVAMSLRYPMMTVHLPTERCAIQEPHESKDCGEFAASGDDKLKGWLKILVPTGHDESCWSTSDEEAGCDCGYDDVKMAGLAVESLFGRIREERDRLEAECLMELLHEPTGKMLPVRVRTVVQALESELGRIKEAALTPEESTSLDEYLRGIVSPKWEDRQFVANIRAKLRSISGGALKEEATQ